MAQYADYDFSFLVYTEWNRNWFFLGGDVDSRVNLTFEESIAHGKKVDSASA